ncbi:MAG: GTPase Era [Rhodospirillales bacterium]|jgi:GTP-binding protein Era|nr:GTPase Era [Rhodospirillales bacterium]
MIEGARPSQCGYVAILGAPNVGKSTLVNYLVGAKVSIVTPKVQTTRTRVLGICIAGASQIVFVDTPGIFAPRRRLDRAMVAAAWSGAADADLVAVLVDSAKGIDGDTRRILERLADSKRNAVLVLNKIDRVKKPALLALATEAAATARFAETFMISALNGDGVGAVKTYFASAVPEGPWLFPEDQISDMPLRLLAAEVTREKVFLELRQELPYAATVETERWQERGDGSVRIEQVIFVKRNSQKGIVLGKGGQRVKAIGAESRRELEELFERRVHLFLFVKVRERWGDDPERYREWGLDFNA